MTPEGPTNFKMTEAYRRTYYPEWMPILETAEDIYFPTAEELLAVARECEDPEELISHPGELQAA
ncbi:hypothetical protein ASF43_03125 [Pseudorhodoferax sp. Leaf267]|nr:hypothetical protein ASF43_03125 [Pseudorhodoferax sp. Leaf267]